MASGARNLKCAVPRKTSELDSEVAAWCIPPCCALSPTATTRSAPAGPKGADYIIVFGHQLAYVY
eukprot:5788478-Alexandrium_andersonii.AAC.1